MVGQRQRVQDRRRRLDLTAQRVKRGKLPGRDLVTGESAKGGEQRLALRLEGVDRPGGGSRRVVDLVRYAGGERAEGDEGLALPRRRLDGTCGAIQPLDEVPAEREPGVEPLTQHFRRHPQHPPAGCSAAGREIHAVLVPGAEPAGPAARHVHIPDHGVLAADVAHEVDGTLDEHPPEVSVLALAEQIDAGLDANLGTALDQLRELAVSQAVEEAEGSKLAGAHHIVAR